MSDTKNVFVSHIHEDDRRLGAMKELLAERGLDIRDSSISSDAPNDAKSPEYIKHSILAPKLQWAGTMLVVISAETNQSEYVQWEISYAEKTGTRIIGVFAPGSTDADLPDGLEDFADGIVAWNGDAIFNAIQGTPTWQRSTGQPRAVKDIPRHNC
jgi:MTH538 TIR-like domain (DUF1863)